MRIPVVHDQMKPLRRNASRWMAANAVAGMLMADLTAPAKKLYTGTVRRAGAVELLRNDRPDLPGAYNSPLITQRSGRCCVPR
jgi:hypothetical protein